MKANNHKINSVDSGKAFDILQQYFMIKKPQTFEYRRDISQNN